MEADWSKPRKIFHFDTLHNNNKETQEEFFQGKKSIIEKTVAEFLLSEQANLSMIVPLSRALQSLLIRKGYPMVLQSLLQIFEFAYRQLLQQSQRQSNILLFILAYYISKKEHYKTLFTILNNYLSPYSYKDSLTIEEKAYNVLCQEIIKNPHFQQIGQQLLSIIQHFRQTQDHRELLLLQMQLNILTSLNIYKHFDSIVLEQSKHYFSKKSIEIPKNEDIFDTIDQALKRQTLLNKILKPSENTVQYLQKEFIQENHQFFMDLMDSLIQQNKFDKLKLLWSFTSRLGNKQKQLLENNLKNIIKNIQDFIGQNSNISKILFFREKINYVITNCFASSRSLQNILYNTIQEVLLQGQKEFNQALRDKIFEQEEKESYELIQQLFKLIPNKQKFIKEFEVTFFKWVIHGKAENVHYQEGIVHMMKKQCGSALCKKIERMVFDVWREGKMVYYSNSSSKFKCRLLSINDWPKIKFNNIVLPDRMKEIVDQFQYELKKSPQHASKELQWVSELGTIEMSINGIISRFSQTEAALIFILDKSFRPMNACQLSEILHAKLEEISEILTILYQNSILEFNQHNNTFDINDSNIKGYLNEKKKEKHSIEEVRQNEIKDNSIIIDAAIVKILKRKKVLPKTELGNIFLESFERIKPKLEEINQSIERLEKRQFLDIDKSKGILHYRE